MKTIKAHPWKSQPFNEAVQKAPLGGASTLPAAVELFQGVVDWL